MTKCPKTNKGRYATWEDANRHLGNINKCDSRIKKPIRVYECPFCNGFHLTSREDFVKPHPIKHTHLFEHLIKKEE
jgi:hypothetical protein